MRNPELVIGSDRLELYEYFLKRKDVLSNQNRTLFKIAIYITAAHFVLV
jgi:hypothetical protein